MLKLAGKIIDIGNSKVLYNEPFSEEILSRDWVVYGGQWDVQDGWLTGRNALNAPGMIVSKGDFPGNIIMDFEARTVLPSSHDIDFMWNGSWDEEKNERGPAYVGGIAGWWDKKVGFEKSPDYAFNAMTPLFEFIPGKIYHIMGGSINGHCFIFIDGTLVIEAFDPQPIDNQKYAKIGFEAYASHIQVRKLTVRNVCWKEFEQSYEPEF